ncbi:MAG: type II toxin-antitoxin system VapC family toxin [Polyangiaceae bacterium]|nr:type II toxin-antitoxin system VapC family toxin [Polyangiaceae bacterium]
MIVLDASAAIELLLCTAVGKRVARRIASPDEALFAPHLIDVEVAQVLRRFVLSAQLSLARAEEALVDFEQLGLNRYPHGPLLSRVWELRGRCTAYDAVYLALAEATGACLLTCDRKLGKGHGTAVTVEVLH